MTIGARHAFRMTRKNGAAMRFRQSDSIRARAVLPIAIVIVAAACGSLPTQNYYVLTPTISAAAHSVTSAATRSEPGGPVVFIDRAHLPELVDRPQFVLGDGEGSNKVRILEQQRWAEPLRAAIPQVIAVDLERQLPNARVSASPLDALPADAWRLTLDVQRFEARPGDAVTVEIGWTLTREGVPGAAESTAGANDAAGAAPAVRGHTVRTGRSTARERIGSDDFGAIAAAASRALATISREIAAALH